MELGTYFLPEQKEDSIMEKLYIGRGKDADNAALIAFLDDVFFSEETDGTNFLDLLPKIYKDKYRPAYNNIVAQRPDGAFRAAIGNFDNDMLVGGVDLKTCCIGNVAVGKDCRGEGYMIDLMNASIEDMKKRGVALSYLGGQRQRYGYFGYETSGTAYDIWFSRQSFRHALKGIEGDLTLEPLAEDDMDAIRFIDDIYKKAPVISRRAPDTYYDILCSWREKPYLIRDNGSLTGYIVTGRDMDYVPEFGLSDPALLPRFVATLFGLTGKDGISFRIAPYEKEKLGFFTKTASSLEIDDCEAILVLDWKKVLTAYLNAKASYETLCDGELTVKIHGACGNENLRLSVRDNAASVTEYAGEADFEPDALAAVRAFFSNYPSDRAAFPPEVRQWLPLPMYFSSRDTM